MRIWGSAMTDRYKHLWAPVTAMAFAASGATAQSGDILRMLDACLSVMTEANSAAVTTWTERPLDAPCFDGQGHCRLVAHPDAPDLELRLLAGPEVGGRHNEAVCAKAGGTRFDTQGAAAMQEWMDDTIATGGLVLDAFEFAESVQGMMGEMGAQLTFLRGCAATGRSFEVTLGIEPQLGPTFLFRQFADSAPCSDLAFDVFQARCVEPMLVFAEFSGAGLAPAASNRATLSRFASDQTTIVSFDTAPAEGRRQCSVSTQMTDAEIPFAEWVAGMVAQDELEPVSDSAWLTTFQVEPRLAVEISAEGGQTTFWLTETHLEAEDEPHARTWVAPGEE